LFIFPLRIGTCRVLELYSLKSVTLRRGFFYVDFCVYSVIIEPMKLIKEIVAQWGNVNAEQCQELACYFPDTPLIIKWGYLPREEVKASEVAQRIALGEGAQGDYCREVFIKSESFRKLKEVLGVK
jgi:hypothetical protein